MKRIDLHIHTCTTEYDDQSFDFDLNVLLRYIAEAKLDAIAVTNHNSFNRSNFEEIAKTVEIPVFPGVELNITKTNGYAHVLVIAPETCLGEFDSCMQGVQSRLTDKGTHISWSEVVAAFPNLKNYLVIPHYKKNHKNIDSLLYQDMKLFISALEVANAKKWLSEYEHSEFPVVVFSDSRPGQHLAECEADDYDKRYTYAYSYLNNSDLDVASIKKALLNKQNISIFKTTSEYEILPEGLPVSRGLNVIVGKRSTGKTFTLKRILDAYTDSEVTYIKQFDITQAAEEKTFQKQAEKDDSKYFIDYYRELNALLEDYYNIDKLEQKRAIERYEVDLQKFAHSPEDDYSKCIVYGSKPFIFVNEKAEFLEDCKLIASIDIIVKNKNRKSLIEKYLGEGVLQSLKEAIILAMKNEFQILCTKKKANEIVGDIKGKLAQLSKRGAPPLAGCLGDYFKTRLWENKLVELLDICKTEKQLDEEDVGGFKKERKRCLVENATDARTKVNGIPSGTTLQPLFALGITTWQQLEFLAGLDQAIRSEGYKFLFKIETSIKDKNGISLSGGQRAEYVFTKKIKDASLSDIVLIDEPESSFDNIFLNTDICTIINKLAQDTTVFMATHNNNLGVSIRPGSIIYTCKTEQGFDVFTGFFASEYLISKTNRKIKTSEVLLNTMEAGKTAYRERGKYYENHGN